MVNIGDLNPFSQVNFGVGAIGNALILFAIAVVIMGMIGWLIYWRITQKQYNKFIPLYKSFNGVNYKQATYRAKNVPISKAGDSLWYVRGVGKWLPPATLMTGKNEYSHEERDDGEWINFQTESVNDKQKKAGVVFIQQDMRTQRVATGQILEQRLINKGFWDKWKDSIIQIVFYMITSLLMIIIFYQWGDIVEKTAQMLAQISGIISALGDLECIGTKEVGIVPAFLLMMFRRKK